MKSAKRHRRRLSCEQLEQRVVLDGGGFSGLLLAGLAPDSQLGDDPHVDTIGADASPLEFAGGIQARVDSFIDSAGDIDVFQFDATGETLRIAGLLVEGQSVVHVIDEAGDNVVGVDATEPRDGFVQCEWGDFGFCDVFPTSPGDTYFVTIGGHRVETSEYYFEFFQKPELVDPTAVEPGSRLSNPDSSLGDDVHADEIGANATALVFAAVDSQEIIATVDSYLDEASDVDVFRFMAHHSSVTVSAYSWFDVLDFSVELYDSRRNLIASSEVHSADPTGAGAFANLSLSLNTREPYYVMVSGVGDAVGEYVLNVFQTHLEPVTSSNDDADSKQGGDPHADHIGPDASQLALDESGGTFVNSFIDTAGDVDVFQFTGTGGFALAVAMNLGRRNLMSVRVFDADRSEVKSTAAVGGLVNARGLSTWRTTAGQTYYIKVAARDDIDAQYVLGVFVDTLQEDANGDVDGFNAALAGLPDAPGSHDRLGGIGDANFDGSVDAIDFAIWNQNKFQYVQGPRNGDFNGDGVADAADFNIWNDNRFTRSAAADDDSASDRVPKAAAGTGLGRPVRSMSRSSNSRSESASITMPVARAVISSARLTNRTTSYEALTSQNIDFVMAQVSVEKVTTWKRDREQRTVLAVTAQTSTERVAKEDIRDWAGNRRPRRESSLAVSGSKTPQHADNIENEACTELVDKLFSDASVGHTCQLMNK